jgi:hypothetical protein
MKYQITYKEVAQNFRADQWLDVEDELNRLESWLAVHPDTADEFSFSLEGKVVTLKEISNAVSQAREAFYAKRAETKKPVRISVGATCLPNTYRTVWVKK